MAAKDDYLIDTLVEMGLLMSSDIETARAEADATGEGVIDTLVKQGVIASSQVATAKAAQLGVEFIPLGEMKIADDAIAAVPRHVAKRFNVVPVFKTETGVVVALADPSDLDALDGLQHAINMDVEARVATPEDIEAALNKYYGGGSARDDSVSKMIQDITEGEVEIGNIGTLGGADEQVVEADAPIIKLVNQVIVEAFKSRASDIHLEPLAKKFRVRYRIDGVLHEMQSPPKTLQASIISRLKIQSNMSIAEKRIPQDGRIQASVGGKLIDLRVSCLPTVHGESIVMRILDKEGLRLGLPELGFFTDDQQTFERLIGLPDGILLVTGPTGSGKTTTLYSCLNYHQSAGPQDHYGRRPGGISARGHQPGAGERNDRVHVSPGRCARCSARRPTWSCWEKFATWRRRRSQSMPRSLVTLFSRRCTRTMRRAL